MVRPPLPLWLTLLTVTVAAEQGTPTQPGVIAGPHIQRPARDPREAPAAVIRGRIVAADTGAPLRRAQVRAFAPGVRESRGTSTDALGRFELRDLSAGRWELLASKAGYVTLRYGQRRPREAGQPIELNDGETMARVTIALPRGAVLTGRILDEFGEPVASARVQAMRHQSIQGARQLIAVGRDNTDDTGAFRIYGLMPGDYYISAVPQASFIVETSNDPTGYAPTYYPGTANPAEAQRVSVRAAQELSNVNFALLATRTVTIAGTAIDSKGERIANGFISIQDASQPFAMTGSGAPVRADGTFTVSNVTPGAYVLSVNASVGQDGGDDAEFASTRVTVANDDIKGIVLATSKGATVSGAVMAAPGTAGTLDTAGLLVVHQPVTAQDMRTPLRPVRVEPDGSFRLTGVYGQRVFRVNGLSNAWTVKTVLLNGHDITDEPIDVPVEQEVTGLHILVTDRVTEVTGRVTDSKGAPVKGYTVVIFPDDPAKWRFPSRHVRSGRADQDGVFEIRALPPDERYLAVAVDYIEEGEGGDPEFLEQMRDRATSLSLAEGETKMLDLKLIARGS